MNNICYKAVIKDKNFTAEFSTTAAEVLKPKKAYQASRAGKNGAELPPVYIDNTPMWRKEAQPCLVKSPLSLLLWQETEKTRNKTTPFLIIYIDCSGDKPQVLRLSGTDRK